MTGSPDNNLLWRRTTILVRADILERAREQKIDISLICNRALAGLLGIDASQQSLGFSKDPIPVMVAPDIVPVVPIPPDGEATASLHPVVNANDPTAVRTMLKAKTKRPAPPAAAISGQARSQEKPPVAVHEDQDGTPKAEEKIAPPKLKAKTPGTRKRGKEDSIKKFITESILRGEPDDATISRDEMFDLFSRWCRDQRITPVPEKKRFSLALKNQFAFSEKTENGIRCWTKVRIR